MGKKSKSFANKLAKMSDDQRAKYMQLKADQEEENRRRKEQLLNTFMKNKIRKEDVFSRLNKAKINLEWHQFLRQKKCTEMKENCEHLRRWLERTLNIKNKVIDNLVKELDEAEFQYSNNLQSHLLRIDEMLKFFKTYSHQLKEQFDCDLSISLDEWVFEGEIIKNRSEGDIEHLKTIFFGQEHQGENVLQEQHDYYLKKLDEFAKENKQELQQLKKCKEALSGEIWSKILLTINIYVDKTDKRRAQLAEMQRIDNEFSEEINKNVEKIKLEEIQIERYRGELKTLVSQRTESINFLKNTINDLNKLTLNLKMRLKKDLDRDEKKLRVLSESAKESMDELRKWERKGEFLLGLAQNCRKYETQKEKVLRFSKNEVNKEEFFVVEEENNLNGFMKINIQEQKDEEKDSEEIEEEEEEEKVENEIFKTATYKILIKQKFKLKPIKSEINLSEKVQKELETFELKQKCLKKPIDLIQQAPKSSKPTSTGIIDESLDYLMKLNGIWNLFNKVKIDCGDLKAEKLILLEENQRLKCLLKRILEEAVLESRNVEKNKVRRYFSAPIRYA
ncbi:dynein regulatory complex subunit 2-like [Onthophagus taurus]|uniref:dynein regulatory complex subunit 2-like n=1 Tax=Onthophagus taurus TaxID=166361 RepID=UPI000C2077A4|nr:coiled-coil domain-containing protein 65-like [Onthophagus taurus]